MEKRTEQGWANKKAYIKKYFKENVKCVSIRLNRQTDKDVIDKLQQENVSKYVIKLIRQDIEKK